MLQSYVRFQSYVFSQLERFGRRKHWQLELAFISWLYAGFVAFPSFDIYSTDFAPAWDMMYRHADHMLEPMAHGPESHEAKLTFRLFFPVLVNLFHLGPVSVLAIKFVAGLIIMLLFIRACMLQTGDKLLTILLTMALACSHMPRCTFDISGKIDTFAFLFLLLPIAFRNVPAAFLGVFLAAWVDERGLVASSLILLFYLFEADKHRWKLVTAVVVAWVAYLGLRVFLSRTYHLYTPTEGTGLSILKAQFSSVWLGIWVSLEGLWLLVLPAIVYWLRGRQYVKAILTAGALGLVLMVGLMVLDVSRSVAYAFPVIFLALPVFQRMEIPDDRYKIAMLVLLISFAFPAYVIGDFNRVVWQLPMPLQLMRMLFL